MACPCFLAPAYQCVPILRRRLPTSRERHPRNRRIVEPLIPSLLRNQGPTFLNNSSTTPHRYACVILITRMPTALGISSPVSESSWLLRFIVHPQPHLRSFTPSETTNVDIVGINTTVDDQASRCILCQWLCSTPNGRLII